MKIKDIESEYFGVSVCSSFARIFQGLGLCSWPTDQIISQVPLYCKREWALHKSDQVLSCVSSLSDRGSWGRVVNPTEPQVIYLEKENGDQNICSTADGKTESITHTKCPVALTPSPSAALKSHHLFSPQVTLGPRWLRILSFSGGCMELTSSFSA